MITAVMAGKLGLCGPISQRSQEIFIMYRCMWNNGENYVSMMIRETRMYICLDDTVPALILLTLFAAIFVIGDYAC